MAARRIDGKAIAQDVRAEVKRDVAAWVEQGHEPPGLATVLVGDDPASALYVGSKQKASAEVGIQGFDHRLPDDATHDEVDAILKELAADPRVSGILLQLPTPPQVDGAGLAAMIPPSKDVDGLTPISAGLLAQGRPGLRPCTPSGIMELLRRHDVPLEGAEAVVVGRSDLVGRPISALLLHANATVTICHSRTRDLAEVCRRADVLVAAVGRPGLVRGDWVKPGATVIDVGSPVGDVDFESAAERAGLITPVPGGVGPMTIAMLLRNTLHGGAGGGRRARGSGVELSRLRPGDLIAAAGGVALLVVMFLEWYAAGGVTRVGDQEIEVSVGANAWEAFAVTDIWLALTALAALALAGLTATPPEPGAARGRERDHLDHRHHRRPARALPDPQPARAERVHRGQVRRVPRLRVGAGDRRRRLALDARRGVGRRARAGRRAPHTAPEGPQDPAPPPEAEPRA